MIKGIFKIAVFFLISVYSYAQDSLIFSEVMFAPDSDNAEFIELFNLSSDTINLNGWGIKYHTSKTDFFDTSKAYPLPPHSFAVIFEGDYDSVYVVPDTALTLKIIDNAFGSGGMSNSSDRELFLISPDGDTVATYVYSADNQHGFSDEKIILNADDSPSNWKNSECRGGTPGRRNSVSPLEYDLAIKTVSFEPKVVFQNDTMNFEVKISNEGLKDANDFQVLMFIDDNGDSVAESPEFYDKSVFPFLASGDSVFADFSFSPDSVRHLSVIFKISFSHDSDTTNNIAVVSFWVRSPPNNKGDVVINEIMYKPHEDEPEWVEIFNNTDKIINLKGWTIRDKSTRAFLSKDTLFISPKGFVLFARDSIPRIYGYEPSFKIINLPSLNNNGDILVLRDSLERTIDSVNYSSAWGGGKGISLERKIGRDESNSSENWGSSVSRKGGTPERENSITPKNFDLALLDFRSPDNYNAFGTPLKIEYKIMNLGKHRAENTRLKIYADANMDSEFEENELLKTIEIPALSSGDNLKGIDSIAGLPVGKNRIGGIIDFSEDEFSENDSLTFFINTVNIDENPRDIIINEIMYAPSNGEPEWVEFFNGSGKGLNIKGHFVCDASKCVCITDRDFFVPPRSFFVVSRDSSVTDFHKLDFRFLQADLPTLNNSGDEVILKDSLYRTIDSVGYKGNWGKSGRSLERIWAEGESCDSSNWGASIAQEGSTPGYQNSLTPEKYDLSLDSVWICRAPVRYGDSLSVGVKVTNRGRENAVFVLEISEDVDEDSLPDSRLFLSDVFSLAKGDTAIVSLKNIGVVNDAKFLIVNTICDSDAVSENNLDFIRVIPTYPAESIVINEFNFDPPAGEPEWIEIYNRSDITIDLFKWEISDVRGRTGFKNIFERKFYLPPKKYLVIAKDSSIKDYFTAIPAPVYVVPFGSLNDDMDGIVLKDGDSETIDSVFYRYYWGKRGVSLERISPIKESCDSANWFPTKDAEGGTPGRLNSVTPRTYDLTVSDVRTNPFFPLENDNVRIDVLVRNNGAAKALNFGVEIFVENEKHLFRLDSMRIPSLEAYDSLWIESLTAFRIHDSVVIFARVNFVADEDTFNNSYHKAIYSGAGRRSIEISEFMVLPPDSSVQWVELKNISGENIDIKNWSISDVTGATEPVVISPRQTVIKPSEYFLISRDSMKNIRTGTKVFVRNFGRLGKTHDGIVLKDFRGETIDSLFYNKNWEMVEGRSLERRDFNISANDSSNWIFSLNFTGNSAGEENSIEFAKPGEKGSVVLNEIMFETSADMPEYVEFYNASETPVDIGGWKLEDSHGRKIRLSHEFKRLKSYGYFVLASDSNLFERFTYLLNDTNLCMDGKLELPNDGESLVLKDVFGHTIDSVNYKASWKNKNILITKDKSLEKINPTMDANDGLNWSTCVAKLGGTPGKQNSLYSTGKETRSGIEISPNPFSPDADGFEDFTIISYGLKAPVAQIRIRIFDDTGRLVRTITQNKSSASKGKIIFDGCDDSGTPLRIGMYIVLLEAVSDNGKTIETLKDIVVIARKLN